MIARDPVPAELWGKDHWSTLAYAECRCVDNKGVPNRNHMRTDTDRHPALVGPALARAGEAMQTKYPTRLAGGALLADHDDWDCIEDAVTEGLLRDIGTGINPVWRLTKSGCVICSELRAHKAAGGSFATFQRDW